MFLEQQRVLITFFAEWTLKHAILVVVSSHMHRQGGWCEHTFRTILTLDGFGVVFDALQHLMFLQINFQLELPHSFASAILTHLQSFFTRKIPSTRCAHKPFLRHILCRRRCIAAHIFLGHFCGRFRW